MSDLTTRQQKVMRRALAPWHAIQTTAYADRPGPCYSLDQAKSTASGGSMDLDGVSGWYQTTSRGIGWSPRLQTHGSPSDYGVFVPWADIQTHLEARARHSDVKRLRQYGADCSVHNANAPRFGGSDDAEARHYWDEVHMPRHRELVAEAAALLDVLWPATAADAEPLDLLELLEAGA